MVTPVCIVIAVPHHSVIHCAGCMLSEVPPCKHTLHIVPGCQTCSLRREKRGLCLNPKPESLNQCACARAVDLLQYDYRTKGCAIRYAKGPVYVG